MSFESDGSNAVKTEIQDAVSEKAVDSSVGPVEPTKRDWRFWMIFVALSVTGLLSALEVTVTSNALPTIVHDLDLGENYEWIVNVFFLASMVFQPLTGQIANIFGRRWPMIFSVCMLIIGSGISGGATNVATLISGRAIQGVGGGGINVLIELIICDLVPLRERSKFLAIIMATFTVGTSLGPFIGGEIVQKSSWRWVFYLNLPIGGAALLLLFAFLQVRYTKETTISQKLKRIDWVGNLILIPSLVAILIALTDAGTTAPWSSWRIILPLTIGLCGLVAFQIFESSRFCLEPTIPTHLFSNRTTITALVLAFIHTIDTVWVIYFLPVYFQAILLSTPGRSGVQLLPTLLILVPFAIAGGITVAKFGRYRPLHHIGFALMAIGFGLFTMLESESSVAEWVIFQAITAAGSGIIVSCLLPAIQASLTEADSGSSTATFAFTRSFGAVWGLTVPAAIFNNQFDQHASRIADANIRQMFVGGKAYASWPLSRPTEVG
ncbi:MFS efflux transporter aclA [Hyphodiscus hymeniophilus]|uniref:MFS efflux transporter aclA n=1 Tax=Hyphodiscus hymeniophilus TaxID=353542 RepID=A0A9P7AVN8_9HELO|nr:MFS efflux transporter aclA [Hyphodiscus hymeniophilus]